MGLKGFTIGLLGSLLLSATLFAAHNNPEPVPAKTASLLVSGLSSQTDLYHRALSDLEQRLQRDPQDLEASLLKGLLQFKAGDLDAALDELDSLTRREPKFHLAHLVRGDLLLARSHTVSDIGAGVALGLPRQTEELERLREEARMRLKAYLAKFSEGPWQGKLPRALMMLGESIETAILVDKYTHRLFVYQRNEQTGAPELVRDYYVSTGKLDGNKQLRGDLRTPEGVYFITRHIPDEKLPDLYGVGAFPMNYPNEWDRRQGKTGYGIWLHGTDFKFYSRPPQDSEGCVVLPNPDLQRVSDYLQPGRTPIVVTERAVWMEAEQWQHQRDELIAAIESWRADWASGDVEAYLGHYADGFWTAGHDKGSWVERKRRIARAKRYQHIALSDLSLFIYPDAAAGGRPMAVVNFRQQYDSNNFSSDMRKRLYLNQVDGRWQVLYEGRQ